MQNDIEKLYKQANKEGFADGEVKYSKNVDLYTEKQYNNFGWVRANDVLTSAEYEHFKSSLSDNKNLDFKFTKNSTTKETIIPTGATTNLSNVLVYTKGTFRIPIITKVVRIDSDDVTDVAIIRSEILDNESRGSKDTLENVKSVYGQQYFVSVEKQDMPTFQEYRREQKRSVGGKNSENTELNEKRTENRTRNTQTEAGLDNSAFSNADKYHAEVEKSEKSVAKQDNVVYNENTKSNRRADENVRTNEFRDLQKRSRELSDKDIESFHRGSKECDESLQRRLSGIFRRRINDTIGLYRNAYESVVNVKSGKTTKFYKDIDATLFHDVFEIVQNIFIVEML